MVTGRGQLRWAAVAIAAVALLVPISPAAAAPQKIVPVGPAPEWGCVQGSPPSLSVRTPRGALLTPTFAQARTRIAREARVVARRLKRAKGARARRLRARARSLAATAADARRCRAGTLPAPAASRRSFAFVCLHGFVVPSVIVEGSCAVDLRPRGTPSGTARAAAATYDRGATYDTLDVVLFAECKDEGGSLEGPERMDDLFPLYIVRCGSGEPETPLPAQDAWTILGMEVENCDEILAADGDCPPPKPMPPSDPSPSPRPAPDAPKPDCIILGMETENPDC